MTKDDLRNENIIHVMDVAVACFKEFGVDHTLIKTVAQKAGLSERSVWRYFDDKKDLVIQSISHYMKSSRGKLVVYSESETFRNLSGIMQCESYFRYMFQILKEDPSLILLETELQIYLWHSKDYAIYEVETTRAKYVLEQALLKGIRDGTIKKEIDAIVMAESMVRRFKGFIQSVPSCNTQKYMIDELSEKCFEQGLDMIVEYLRVD